MKYIRTKDGIYKVVLVSPLSFVRIDKRDGTYPDVFEKDIIKQADTIEELCDAFVLFYDNEETKPDLTYRGGFNDLYFQNELKHSAKCYGAIWTDKGLIYVAKMNDKGELELL